MSNGGGRPMGQGGMGVPRPQGAGLLGQPGFNPQPFGPPGVMRMDQAGGPPGMAGPPGAGGDYGGGPPGMAGAGGGADYGMGGMQQANGAPPGTPFSADPNMGGAGGPQMDPNAAAAGYTAVQGPYGYRGQMPGGFRAQAGVDRAFARQAQPHTMEAGGMGAPSYQGGGYANPGPLAAGAAGLAANGGRPPLDPFTAGQQTGDYSHLLNSGITADHLRNGIAMSTGDLAPNAQHYQNALNWYQQNGHG